MKIFTILFLFMLPVFFACSENGNNCPECDTCNNVFLDYEATVIPVYIVDGDTYDIQEQSENIRIRILGIDFFETRRGARLTEQAQKVGITEDSALSLGNIAENFANEILLNNEVMIYRDSLEDNMDTYGRLLRHTFLNDSSFADMLTVRKLVVPE